MNCVKCISEYHLEVYGVKEIIGNNDDSNDGGDFSSGGGGGGGAIQFSSAYIL